ncbi:MAG: glutamine--fructose-6-phosphate transaminase (isomerizing) [Christensenellales bacterium]
MCGIVGYIGPRQAVSVLLEGLEKLEYRGYDSAGIAVNGQQELQLCKKKGRLSVLKETLAQEGTPAGTCGIGHTRWATHGAPSDINAHPHTNIDHTIAVVHNGIIENYMKIKEWLSLRGYSFRSQTDTEIIAHLVDYYYEGNLVEAVQEAVQHLSGSYALCIMSTRHPEEFVAVRKDSPLVIGLGQGENFIASDTPALLKYTRDVIFMEDGEVARITVESVDIVDAYGIPVSRDVYHVDWQVEAAEKGGYPHFMLKEIFEEPRALRDTLSARISENGELNFDGIGLTKEMVQNAGKIVIVACGTAYHAGLSGKYYFERVLGIPVEVDIASEYRYRAPLIRPGDLFIAISQSGETADTLAAMRLARANGATILAITNVVGSTLSREADAIMYTLAGPEIAVASTKAYTTQLMCLVLLMLQIGRLNNILSEKDSKELIAALRLVPGAAAQVLESEMAVKKAAYRHSTAVDVYFLGRNLDFVVALEGSLKLKEISYIHAEAFAAGELKHGPIALIEEGTLVIVVATQPALYEKTASNMKEVKARGARVLAICPAEAALVRDIADEVIDLPQVHELLMPILAVIPAQLFAYYCAVQRGFDVDKPRNLAKSVTVE